MYAILLKSNFFTSPQPALVNNADGILYKQILKLVANTGRYANYWSSSIAFMLLFIQAVLFGRLINKTKLFTKPNYLASISYLLLTSLFTNWNVLSAGLMVNTLFLFVWQYIIQLQNTTSPKTLLFNLGLLICGANFLYSFSFAFLLLAIIGLLSYRAFRLNEYIVLLMGYFVPFYCLFTYQYLTSSFSISTYKIPLHFILPYINNSSWFLMSVGIILVILLVGIFFVQTQSSKMNIQSRKNWSIIFFWLLISIIIPFLNADFRFWIICMLPIAAFFAAAFYYIKDNRVKTFLHWGILAFALFITYFLK